MKDGLDYDDYIDYLNHLFLQRMDDAAYLGFMLISNLGEM